MKKKSLNILLTCAGGSATIYLADVLKRNFNIFLVDASDKSVGPLLGFPFRIVPPGNASSYQRVMQKIIKDWQIDCIVPGADEELVPLREVGPASQVMIVSPETHFVKLCLNKKSLMAALAEQNISTLLPFQHLRSVKYPAIVKPIYGRGSRDVHIVTNRTQLKGYLNLYEKLFSDVLVQSYIGGDEYTVSVIVNNRNRLIGIVPKKILSKRGITRAAVTENNSRIEDACRAIVENLSPCGPFNVQLKLRNRKVYVFEINPRLSTTSVLTDRAFGNEVSLFISHYDQDAFRPHRPMQQGMKLYRYEHNVFA